MNMNKYQVNWVDIDLLHEDKSNPNAMDENEFNALVREISIHGIIQPIITRPCLCELIEGEHRCIVGGEHRWRAARQLKMKEVPCIDLSIDDTQAKILMVNLNSIHGRVIPLKLANLIVDLNRSLPMEDIRSRLYLNRDCLQNITKRRVMDDLYERLLAMKREGRTVRGVRGEDEMSDKNVNRNHHGNNGHDSNSSTTADHDTSRDDVKIKILSITLNKQQYDDVVHVLDDIALKYGCTRGDALVILCKIYNQNERRG